MRLKVASRKSDLARWQSVQVARRLESVNKKPHIEFIFKASLGDQDLDIPLAALGTKGVFTEDFYADLIAGHCDLVVHSWKDLPVLDRSETQIAMTLPRADARDILLIPAAVWSEAQRTGCLRVLTSSPRRVYNLTHCLSELLPRSPTSVAIEFSPVRGNVPTRLTKMHQQGCALVLAKAGLDRLLAAEDEGFIGGELSLRHLVRDCRFMILPLSLNPGAPAEGALAVETIRDERQGGLNAMCAQLNDEKTYTCVQQEREILKRYGGGCQQKIGVTVLIRDYGRVIALRGLTDQGEVLQRWEVESATPWTRAATPDRVFPLQARDNSWFERQAVKPNMDLTARPALLVARGDAWPRGFCAAPQQFIWTAGIQTWRRLAELGVWVHGSHDGLGEGEATGIEPLTAGPVRWTKLSHQAAQGEEVVATYQLVPKPQTPDLADKTHFFWLSSTSFERARQLFPQQVNNGFNAAGPGSTFEHIRGVTGLKHPPKVFAGLEQFLRETLP